ncbi:unnamed protein product [Ectocarpus sp. 13 AM-2016]
MHQSAAPLRRIPHLRLGQPRRWLGTRVLFTEGGGCSVDDGDHDDGCTAPPGPRQVAVKLLAAPCTPADLRTTTARPPPPPPPSPNHHHASSSGLEFPRTIGGTEALWEIAAVGGEVSSLRPGDLAVPVMAGNDSGNGAKQAAGTWRSRAILTEASLVKVPIVWGSGAAAAGVQEEERGDGGGFGVEVAAHCSGSVATAIRILEDFVEKELGAGDRVVFTGASSAVAQILLQLAASRGLESVCLVNSEEEAALALKLGAWKAALLKEFKAMRMDNACIVADGEGGVLGFTAARALRFRGCFVSYADLSGGGVRCGTGVRRRKVLDAMFSAPLPELLMRAAMSQTWSKKDELNSL